MTEAPLATAVADTPQAIGRQRGRKLVLLFMAWLAIIVWRLAEFTIIDRDRFLLAMQQESSVSGQIPPRRGRLLDRNGQPLAWSTRHFQVHWQVPADVQSAAQHSVAINNALQLRLHAGNLPLGTRLPLLQDISADQALAVEALQKRGISVILSSYFVRNYISDNPAILRILGSVRSENGMEVGVSGLEKQHDTLLRGNPGHYHVLLDRYGNWIAATWTETQKMHPGYDVYLRIALGSAAAASERQP